MQDKDEPGQDEYNWTEWRPPWHRNPLPIFDNNPAQRLHIQIEVQS